ncbi:MAG: phosphohydrolase [Clostridiales bacterium]|nr:phosphohydrolase [Clostridiales bacterium]
MKLFALADLHLAGSVDKPMDVFGPQWDNHLARIREAWLDTVGEDDLVLIPGDISWAMQLKDALPDFETIAALPGVKLILRGNHDYWWNSLSKVRAVLPPGIHALQNDAFIWGDIAIAGSRGWPCPGSIGFDEKEDRPIYEREVIRMGLSLSKVPKGKTLVCMMHYPPFNERRMPSGFTELFEQHGARHVIYGHLHGKACKNAFEGERNGIFYSLCSADHLQFKPKLILET